MTKKKIKRWQLIGFVVCILIGMIASTQHFAAKLDYHIALGDPLFVVQSASVYWPWQWFIWANDYYDQTPKLFGDTMLGLVGGLVIGMVWMIVLKKRFTPKPTPTSHGSSRWATGEEVQKIGLAVKKDEARGVVIGQNEAGEYLTHDGKEHAFCFAPTRSGKGVGLVIPTLLTWRDSVVVLDIKGENWEITGPWRALFSHCLYLNPADKNSVHFNPLLEIRKGDEEVRDVRNLVEILCDPDGDSKGSDFWTDSAKSVLTATILHVLYAEEDKSLARVLSFLRSPDRDVEETLTLMKTTHHKDGKPHPLIAQSAQSLLNMDEKARSGVISTAESFLTLFEDPVLAEVTSRSDFRLADLQRADNPVSLYLVVPPSDMIRLRPILRLILIQMGSALTESLKPEQRKHRLLMLLDEFPTLGRLDWFESALAYVAGYDIKCYLIAQDLNQIEKAYGQNNAILGNCHIRVTFAPNDERTAKRISDMLGQATAIKKTESQSGKRGSFSLENKSISDVEFARSLLTPGEVMQLPPEQSIVFVAGQYPILADKVRYYADPHFKRRCPQWNSRLQPLPMHGPNYPDLPGMATHAWTNTRAPILEKPAQESNFFALPEEAENDTSANHVAEAIHDSASNELSHGAHAAMIDPLQFIKNKEASQSDDEANSNPPDEEVEAVVSLDPLQLLKAKTEENTDTNTFEKKEEASTDADEESDGWML